MIEQVLIIDRVKHEKIMAVSEFPAQASAVCAVLPIARDSKFQPGTVPENLEDHADVVFRFDAADLAGIGGVHERKYFGSLIRYGHIWA